MQRLRIRVTGGTVPEPLRVNSHGNIAETLTKLLPELSWQQGVLLHAPVGAGKTYAVTHVLLPWAREQGHRILYVSSRTAINSQAKQDIVSVTGELHFRDELTERGWQVQRDFDGIAVITYHALYSAMRYEPNILEGFDILVFDEIHALLEDSSFVPFSGYVLQHLLEHLGGAIRLYLTATPEDIVPLLAQMETPSVLKIIRFKQDYSFLQLHFFHNEQKIIQLINTDSSARKWLVHTPSIHHAQALRGKLSHDCCFLNSVSREKDPEQWSDILRKRFFNEKICFASAAIDAGVSFVDKNLTNIVTFSYSPTTIMQVLGRKRRKGNEQVRLFVWCPDMKDIYQKLRQNQELQAAIKLHDAQYSFWVERHILRPSSLDMRTFTLPDANGYLQINPLALVRLSNEQTFLEKLSMRAQKKHGNCGFDHLVARYFGLKNLDFPQCWLDDAQNGTARANLENLIVNAVGRNMSEQEFQDFAIKFRFFCVEAYGKGRNGKDRDDRAWGWHKIDNKLAELGGQYRLQFDAGEQRYQITSPCITSAILEKGGTLA